ncbi:MAG TPA: histidine kinase dimerization/phosphoacceptor domain -containing protein, partial [Kofleriaceae bacterium]
LLRANENLRHVTDALPIGLFVHHGEVLYANPALGRLLQREPSSITGRPYTDLIDPEEHAAVAERISRLRRGESDAPQDLRLTSSTGTVVVEVSRIELDYDGKPAVLVMCRDTTAERAAAAQIRDSLREKEALLREIHHRVKNNLAVIASLLYLQAEAVKDEHARAALRESRARVHAIALAHEHLYRTEDLGRVELGSYIAALIAHVVSSLGAEARGIDIAVDHPYEIFVPLDAAHPCGLILNELVTNALKHAFPGARTGTVRVEVRSSPRDVTIAVRDDGVGMPAPLERGSSIGMQLVRELAEQLQATLTIQAATPGTLTTLTFPRPLS